MKIITADAIDGLRLLPDGVVDMCVTSPPYYRMRDYGIKGQIGLEPTPQVYIKRLIDVFEEVKRVLKSDGTLWIIIGDSYASHKRANIKKGKSNHLLEMQNIDLTEIKQKDLIGIPWMLAFALRTCGWYLRQDLIWHKPNPMPESVTDRCTKAHEYIFLLSKSLRYYFDHKAIKEPCSPANVKDFLRRKTFDNKGKGVGKYEEVRPDLCRSRKAYMPADFKRNKRSVWPVNTQGFNGAHFAVFPPDLIRPCILAGSKKGGIVLDPFIGSGTTAEVAIEEHRRCIGIEINPRYAEMARKRMSQAELLQYQT